MSSQVCPTDHSYARVCSSGPIQQQMNVSTSGQPGILSIIPRIGPLHISLNGRETVFHDYRQFFETVYNNLFPKSKLAKNPKPWRISLILEVVYSGWLFIRDSVKNKFCFCKDLEYRTLLNLIDNYLPLVLSIYSVTYKLNNFQEYLNAMIRIWVMFVCLERHHYNKAPLVCLPMCSYWGIHHPALYKLLLTNLVIFDEYPVENTHSIIRSKTNTYDTAEQIQKKAKVVFQSKMEQQHIKEHFTQPKKPQWSLNNLKSLKAKCANILANIFTGIARNPGKAKISTPGKTTKVLLPKIFGDEPVKIKVLPLGYCTSTIPDQSRRCDLPGCNINEDLSGKIFEGCSHSFHHSCLGEIQFCPLCQAFLAKKAESLSKTAKEAILNPKERESVNEQSKNLPADGSELEGG